MRILNHSSRTYAVHFKSLITVELNWTFGLLAITMLFLSVLPSSAQFAFEDQTPQPHLMFAVSDAESDAKAAYATALADYQFMQLTESNAQAAESALHNATDGHKEVEPGAVAELYAVYYTAAETHRKAVEKFTASNAEYQHAYNVFNQRVTGTTLHTEVETLYYQVQGLDHGLMDLEDDLAQTNDYTSDLNDRITLLEENYTTLRDTTYNWCVSNSDTTLCLALGYPE